jgi:hypothetical protein
MESIYKRGKVYWIKYYRNGKPFRESTKSNKADPTKSGPCPLHRDAKGGQRKKGIL